MSEPATLVERAIEIASSGDATSVNHIRQLLRREGYEGIGASMSDPRINRQLIDLIRAAQV